MARTIAQIQTQLTDNLVTTAAAAGWTLTPTQWSIYDYKKLMIYVVAVCVATFEQLFDAFKVEVEAIVDVAAPSTAPWWKAQMLKFQYSATDPQVIELNTTTLAYQYPTLNTTYQIIKYCSVNAGSAGTSIIKVAAQSSGAPIPLDGSQLGAAQDYVDTIAVPGLAMYVRSLESDKIYIKGQVWYKGQYSAVIFDSIKASIVTYLANIPFDGVVRLIDLEIAIRNTTGVTDLRLQDVAVRADLVAFGSGTTMVAGYTVITTSVQTMAGYVVPETDTGHTLLDELTLTAV